MRELVAANYPDLAIGITEYDWGAVDHINGATAQADIFSIFGREGLDLATREQVGIHGIDDREGLDPHRQWTAPPGSTLVEKAYQTYRNYDGDRSTFGDTRIRLMNSANVDELSAFAAERSSDGAITVMVVAKTLDGPTGVDLTLAGSRADVPARVWQLTAAKRIERLKDLVLGGGRAVTTVPAQSATLIVIPRRAPLAARQPRPSAP
jgi:hypothetical protein